jgi:hypothetical protein
LDIKHITEIKISMKRKELKVEKVPQKAQQKNKMVENRRKKQWRICPEGGTTNNERQRKQGKLGPAKYSEN